MHLLLKEGRNFRWCSTCQVAISARQCFKRARFQMHTPYKLTTALTHYPELLETYYYYYIFYFYFCLKKIK